MPNNVTVICEWDADAFHRRVLGLESQGFVPRLETYSVTPEMNPETGEIIHLYAIEMDKQESTAPGSTRCDELPPPN
jgi:hypothetical protein